MQAFPTISVFGLGHVGIVQAVCLADEGQSVIGVDRDPYRLAAIAAGRCPLIEPELPILLERVVENGRLRTCASADQAVRESDISIVCVDTPTSAGGACDLGSLLLCLDSIAAAISSKQADHAVVVRSTVPIGTMRQHVVPKFAAESGRSAEKGVECLFIPEFMREGNAVRDYRHPQKIMIGCPADDASDRAVVDRLYGAISAPRHYVGYEMAELAKYADNSWHALKVCFANEIDALSSAFGLDGQELMQLFCQDRLLNISDAYLKPGMPFGGSCLPKDLAALNHMAGEKAVDVPLLASVSVSNERHLERCVNRVVATGARRIGIWGLSFKPTTGDLRNSPALALAERLLAKDRHLFLHDENIAPDELASALTAGHPICGQALEDGLIRVHGPDALDACDVVVICDGSPERAGGRAGQKLVRLS